jgi:hypothetical protein
MNKTLPTQDAPVPVYTSTSNVTIICQHGKVFTFMGKPDCSCDFGWGSLPIPNFSTQLSILKCNEGIPISAYFPNFMQVYYDQTYDNQFPFGDLPYYWILLLLYYAREIKYMIVGFFIPLEVQIVVLTIPCEPLIRPQDIMWATWLFISLAVLIVISLFEKCVIDVNKNVVKT